MTSALRTSRISRLPAPWRRALPALLLVLVALLAIYYDTAQVMVAIWARSDTFAHAFLVLPIVLWLVWRQRYALAALEPKPCPWLLVPMAALALAWLLGDLVSVNSVTQLAMTGLLVLAVPAVLGLQVAGAIAFPLAFLFFAVPLGEFLLPQLMSWTADFTVLALQATGIPVYREGNQFTIPSGSWSVVEACSGVRYLIASFMVGTLFAYLNYRSPGRRWIFAAVSLLVPLVANWIRAYLIVLLGHLSGNTIAVGADHLIYGWVFFGLVIGLVYAIGILWAEPEESQTAVATSIPAPATVPRQKLEKFWQTGAAAVLIGIAPQLLIWELGSIQDTVGPQLTEAPELSGGWQLSDATASDWKPAFANPSAELMSTYESQDRVVGVYIGYYRAQNHQRKLVSSANELVRSRDTAWALVSADGSRTLQLPSQTLHVRTALLRRISSPDRSEKRLLAWQIYWVGDRLTASDQWAKVYGAFDRLFRRSDDSAVIILYALDEPSGSASPALESFTRANLGAVVAQLRKSRDAVKASVATNTYEIPWETRK